MYRRGGSGLIRHPNSSYFSVGRSAEPPDEGDAVRPRTSDRLSWRHDDRSDATRSWLDLDVKLAYQER